MLSQLVLVSLLVFCCIAQRVLYTDVGIEQGDDSWNILGRVQPEEQLTVRFALIQRNLDILEEVFWSVSDPSSPKFHQYWTLEQIKDLVDPTMEDQLIVKHWALQSGCSSVILFGNYMDITCDCQVFEQMLGGVEIMLVEDKLSQSSPKIITGQYSLPTHIASRVEFVQNLAMMVPKRRVSSYSSRVTSRIYSSPRYETPSEDEVIPITLFNLYNISHIITTKSTQNVAEFTNFGYLDSDLQAFDTGVNLPNPNPITAVNPFKPSPPNTECTLDIQMITSVGQNGTNFYWTIDGWVLDFAQELLAYTNPPLVNSISWSSDERTEGQAYNFRTDSEWQKLGTMGVSILAASGDDGAVGASRCSGNTHYFNPGYPTTSPYVTSVGATMLVGTPTTSTTIAPVCSQKDIKCAISGQEDPADENLGGYATGGGFSVYEARPSYQNTVVTAYLNDNSIPKPPASYYNASNRGFPDIAANGYNVLIYRGGKWEAVGGTSCATPIWGGVFALINDVLLQNNKQPLGFANPFLYQTLFPVTGAFNNIGDLTTNNDDGCQYGYTSNPSGWDPVTGLGTPNVGVILNWVSNNLSSFP